MKQIRFFLILTIVLVSACSPVQTPTPKPTPTPTPTPVGTWEALIEGLVYDAAGGPEVPIAGASIEYEVLHSHFRGLQEGRINQTTSDERGVFSLTVMVHDTDSVKVIIRAEGYTTYEERFVGVDLLVGKKMEVGLSR